MGVHMILEFIRSPDIEEGKKKAEENSWTSPCCKKWRLLS